LHPAELFADPDPVGGREAWWVLHTRPRAEKAVARALFAGRVPYFLPVYEYSRRTGGRVQTSHLPLFPGYVFLRAGDEGRTKALETNQVATCIPVPDQEKLREQLEAVHKVMTSGAPIGPEAQLVPGAEVTITRGPLTGLRGKILRRGNRLTFVVEVHLLGQGVAAQIEQWMLEPISVGEGART
jgi:transcriptional antiterminator RfaH